MDKKSSTKVKQSEKLSHIFTKAITSGSKWETKVNELSLKRVSFEYKT